MLEEHKEKLFRVTWSFTSSPDEYHAGPILYLTQKNGSPRKLRPYTLEEAEKATRSFNRRYKRDGARHSLQEVKYEYPRADKNLFSFALHE